MAQSFNSFVLGAYSYNPGTYSPTTWVATDPLFVIGNGTSLNATSNAVTVLKNGNTGIGTATPIQTLDVNGRINLANGVIQNGGAAITNTSDLGLYSLNAGYFMRFVTNNAPIRFYSDGNPVSNNASLSIEGNGNVGLGITPAASKLDILNGNINVVGSNTSNLWTNSNWRPVLTSPLGSVWRTTDAASSGGYLGFGMSPYGWYWVTSSALNNSQAPSYPMRLESSGSLWTLQVCGKIRVTATGCDFVFADNYEKMSWQEKELYYKTHKRLPYVEPAADMESNGLDIGKNFSAILHNVEEDRLDISELFKHLEKLENENKELKTEISELKNKK